MPDTPTPKMVPIPAGALFTVSVGEYSDYRVSVVFHALAEIDAEALRAEWLREHPEQGDAYSFEYDAFLAWVLGKGLREPVSSYEWHPADCRNASEMTVSDADTWEADDAV